MTCRQEPFCCAGYLGGCSCQPGHPFYEPAPAPKARWRWGLLFKLEALWIGFYWSTKNRRLCVNLIPCVTMWITAPGGEIPHGPDFDNKFQITN